MRKFLAYFYAITCVFEVVVGTFVLFYAIRLYGSEEKSQNFWGRFPITNAIRLLDPYLAVCVWAWKQQGENDMEDYAAQNTNTDQSQPEMVSVKVTEFKGRN